MEVRPEMWSSNVEQLMWPPHIPWKMLSYQPILEGIYILLSLLALLFIALSRPSILGAIYESLQAY